jgi:hypothetical protein
MTNSTKCLSQFFAISLCMWGLVYLFAYLQLRKFIVSRYRKETNLVIQHFSKTEIRKAKWGLMSGFILFAHAIAYYILRSIFPEVFGS